MKALWKGYILIGRLGIPVRMYSATQKSGLSFVQLHEKDGSPVKRPLMCRKEDEEISIKETVKGIEYEPGKYVTFTEQELDRINEGDSKAIAIQQFGTYSNIQPQFIEKPYYLVPMQRGERGYVVLREGLDRTESIAVVRYYLYGSEHVGILKTSGHILILLQLRYSAELVPAYDIPSRSLPAADPAEIDAMTTVIERHGKPIHLADFHDEYTERLQTLCKRKAKGLPMPRPEAVPPQATPPDAIGSTLLQMAAGDATRIES